MRWNEVPFRDLFLVPQRNGLYKSKEHHGSGAKVVNMGELFAFDFIGPQEMKRVEVDNSESLNFGVQNGDLLFARRSLIESGAGKCVVVEGVTEPIVFESSLIRVRLDPRRCVPRFYLYYFRDHPGRSAVKEIITGAAQKGIRGSELATITVHNPPLPTQRTIASILSAYDDLIENNTRRIAILEEMAQAIYREWFVNFRFPGHENVKLVESPLGLIPAGWKVVEMSDVAMNGKQGVAGGPFGSNLGTKDYVAEGIPVIRGTNLSTNGRFIEQGFVFVSNEKASQLRTNHAQKGDIIVTQRGTLGQCGMISRRSKFDLFIISQSQMKISVDPEKCAAIYLLHYLRSPTVIGRILNHGISSGVPHINLTMLRAFEVLLPTRSVLQCYADRLDSSEQLIELLHQKNDNLRTTRDLLLPKLISGQLDVEELEIDLGMTSEALEEATG